VSLDHEQDYIWPTYEDITEVLTALAWHLFGVSGETYLAFAVHSRERLESALALPHHGYYETFPDKLAALVRSIACNHGLVDGNKRLAVTVLHGSLLRNGYIWLWSDDDAEAAILRLAEGDSDFRWLSEFIDTFSGRVCISRILSEQVVEADSLETVLRDIQEEYIAALYVAIEGALQHVRESYSDEWEEVLDTLEEELTPTQFVQRWREAISAMAAGPLPRAPAVVRGLRSLIGIGWRNDEALVEVSLEIEDQ